MISAMEKSKLVYILNRDAAANLTISSPLEAHKNSAIIHHIVGLDVGFENPMFAALEVDYTESDQDPTGAAFQNAEKVRLFWLGPRTLLSYSLLIDVDILRIGLGSQPCRPKMERTYRSTSKSLASSSWWATRVVGQIRWSIWCSHML